MWTINTYNVIYNGNGSNSGTAPTDPVGPHEYNTTVNVVTGSVTIGKTGHTFKGWNTQANGNGTTYTAAGTNTFTISDADVTLYAMWEINKWRVLYNANGATTGSAPSDPTLYDYNTTAAVQTTPGALEMPDYDFVGWNTQPDGSGTTYSASSSTSLVIPDNNVTLYAQWVKRASVITQDPTGEQNLNVFVWLDLNGNGKQDQGEPDLPGLPLEIKQGPLTAAVMKAAFVSAVDAVAGPIIGGLVKAAAVSTAQTDVNGYLKLNSIDLGNWIIKAMLPAKLSATQDSDLTADGQIFTLVPAGSTINAWMGVQGHSAIESPIYDSKNQPANQEIEILWEGLDEELLTWDDVNLVKDPVSGVLKLSGLPSGNYRLIRVGSTPSASECVDIVLTEYKTFTAKIITQKSPVCLSSKDAIKAGIKHPNKGVSNGLAETGARIWFENWAPISGGLILLGSWMLWRSRRREREGEKSQ